MLLPIKHPASASLSFDSSGAPVIFSFSKTPCSLKALSPGERRRLQRFKSASAAQHYLMGRRALKPLLEVLKKPVDTSLLSFPNRQFSLSHSGEYALAAGCPLKNLAGIGVDIEKTRCIRDEAMPYFLAPGEQDWVLQQRDKREEKIRLWTVKESLFKAYDGNARVFFNDFSLADSGKMHGEATLLFEQSKRTFKYKSWKMGSYWITLSTSMEANFMNFISYSEAA